MKLLVLLIFFSHISRADEIRFSVERSTVSGLDKMELKKNIDDYEIIKTSNFFDLNNDYRIGVLKPKNQKKLNSILIELKIITNQLQSAEKSLLQSSTTFNGLNSDKHPHEIFFKLNDFDIKKGSILFPKLEKIATKLRSIPLQLRTGIELDMKNKNYLHYRKGKIVKKEIFDPRFFCESPHLPTKCLAREWGAMYLE